MKNMDEYKPLFELINSMEKDITDACSKGLDKFVQKMQNEMSKM